MIKREYCGNRPTKIGFSILDIFIDVSLFVLGKKKNKSYVHPQKILLFNFGHLGDMLMMGYMINALKKQFPTVEIHLVAGRWCKLLVENNPLFDKVFYVNHFQTNRSNLSFLEKIKMFLNDASAFIQEQKQYSYTHSFDFRYSAYNANPLLPFLKIQKKIGFGSRAWGGFLDKEYFLLPSPVHTIDIQIQVLSELIAENSLTLEPILFVAEQNVLPIQVTQDYLMIFPEAGIENKMLDLATWESIVTYYLQYFPQYQVIVCGLTDYTEQLSARLTQKHAENIINACGKLSIPQIIALLKKASGAITLDSFPAHLASTQTPTLCLFKGGSGFEYFPINAKATYIIHNHLYSKEITQFRADMDISYVESFDDEIFKKNLFVALNKLFSINL